MRVQAEWAQLVRALAVHGTSPEGVVAAAARAGERARGVGAAEDPMAGVGLADTTQDRRGRLWDAAALLHASDMVTFAECVRARAAEVLCLCGGGGGGIGVIV